MIYDWDTMLPERAFRTTGFGTRLMTLEGGGKGSRPPDFTPLKEAMLQVGDDMKALGMEQLRFSKQRYADTLPMFEAQAQADMRSRAIVDSLAKDLLQEKAKYSALEDRLISDIARDDERMARDYYAGQATADVQQAFDSQRNISNRNLQRFGINPNSARFAQLNQNFALGASKANVGARNRARRQSMADNFARKATVAGLGRNIPNQATGLMSSASGLGRSGTGQLGMATGQLMAGYGGAMRGLQGQMGAIGGAGNLMAQGYQAQAQYDANQGAMMQGIGQLAGLGAGLYFGNKGGVIPEPPRRDQGGKLSGAGTGTSDSIKAINVDTGDAIAVSNNETVITEKGSKRIGYDVLAGINKGKIKRSDIKPQAIARLSNNKRKG